MKKGAGSPQHLLLEYSHQGCNGCTVLVQTITTCDYTCSPMSAVDVPRYEVGTLLHNNAMSPACTSPQRCVRGDGWGSAPRRCPGWVMEGMEVSTSSAQCCWHLPALIRAEAGGEVALRGLGADARSGKPVLVIFIQGSPAQSNAAATAGSLHAPCMAYLHPSTLLGASAQHAAMLLTSNSSRSDLLFHGSLGEAGEEF